MIVTGAARRWLPANCQLLIGMLISVRDPTVADALLDRLLSIAHRLELKGESLRKRQKQNGKELDTERGKQ